MGKSTKFTRRKLRTKFPKAYGFLPEIGEAAGGAGGGAEGGAGGGGRSLYQESTERLLKGFTKAERAKLTSADFVKLVSGGGGGGGGGGAAPGGGGGAHARRNSRKTRKQRASRKQRR